MPRRFASIHRGVTPPPPAVTPIRPGTTPTPTTRGPVPYDFRRPTKLSREHVRSLQLAYETFARRLTTLLTSGLRQVCHVTLGEITQQNYDDYVGSLNSPTLIVPLQIDPLGTGALELSLPVAFAAVDHMLGGPGGAQPTRALTDIETTLVRGFVEQILGVLRYALEPVVPVEITAGGIEYNPQFLQIASAADAVVVTDFELTLGRESCRMTMCLPLAPLLPRLVVSRPRESAPTASAPFGAALRGRLDEMSVDVRVCFDSVSIDSARLLTLAVGDIVDLRHRVVAPLTVEVSGQPVARALAGRAGDHLAALVVEASDATNIPASKEIR